MLSLLDISSSFIRSSRARRQVRRAQTKHPFQNLEGLASEPRFEHHGCLDRPPSLKGAQQKGVKSNWCAAWTRACGTRPSGSPWAPRLLSRSSGTCCTAPMRSRSAEALLQINAIAEGTLRVAL
jgi:hypothetical protein